MNQSETVDSVVTGGSSGIGKCIAIECYKQGAFITLIARDENKLLQTKKEIEKYSVNDKQNFVDHESRLVTKLVP
ncbi:hypothetical protein BTVI_89838 [Pitangus sulphuratus]|nr:hypothetical protein BTVI_89838 [Pitangus sulphuratus]